MNFEEIKDKSIVDTEIHAQTEVYARVMNIELDKAMEVFNRK